MAMGPASSTAVPQRLLPDRLQVSFQGKRRSALDPQQQHLIVVPAAAADLPGCRQQEGILRDTADIFFPAVMGDHHRAVIVQRLDRADPNRPVVSQQDSLKQRTRAYIGDQDRT